MWHHRVQGRPASGYSRRGSTRTVTSAPIGSGEFGLLGQVEPAGLDAAAGQAGARERARGLATRALGSGLARDGRAGRRSLGAEDLILGLAGKQGRELLLLDRLALDEDLGDRAQLLAVLGEQVLGALVRGLDDAADLVVGRGGDLVGVVGLGRELAAEERLAVVVAEDARTELLAHAEAHDHLLGRRRDLLEIVGRAGGDLAEDDLLRRATTQRHGQVVG